MKRNQSGFTLIEIAIVLVIIGLLLGGVLKGQELINSAKVKNLAGDFKNIPVFIYGYQDKFKALPGDDRAVDTHLSGLSPTCVGGTCPYAAPPASPNVGNGVINGNWDATTNASESYLFWQHVRLAGLAPGETVAAGTTYIPTNAAGGKIGIQSGSTTAPAMNDAAGNPIRGSYTICSDGILGKFVKQLDTTMDDGNYGTGSMLAMKTYAFGGNADNQTTNTPAFDEAATYTVCMGI